MTSTPHHWLGHIVHSPTVDTLCRRLEHTAALTVAGSRGSSTSLLAGALAVRRSQPVLLVVAHLDDADDALEDLALFNQAGWGIQRHRFGALEVLPGQSSVSLELLAERLALVRAVGQGTLQAGTPAVLVTPVQALMQAVPLPEALDRWSIQIRTGAQLPSGKLINWLVAAGYQRADAIEQPGDFAVRGGIVDIFPPGGDEGVGPVRLDFFGDEVETLCRIDTDTMGSGPPLDQVQIIGAAVERLQSDQDTTNVLQLLPPATLAIMHEPLELSEQARGYYERLTNARGIYPPRAVFQQLAAAPHVQVNQYGTTARQEIACQIPVRPLVSFDQSAAAAVKELASLAQDDAGVHNRLVVLCQNTAEQQRLGELLQEHAASATGRIEIALGYLFRGFQWLEADTCLHLVPHHELFHRYQARRRIRTTAALPVAGSKATDAFLQITPGDHVVHEAHGIAMFKALRTMKREGKSEEYLTLEFANRALLHVPATQIDLVQKYVGGFHGRPPLSVLGGKRWVRQKQAVSAAVKEMAAQLLRVQAARAATAGLRFGEDTAWQKEFEAEFPYQETEDQLAAIAAVKKDMADEQPMDRLLCGDVGFGKTEVAIRAAFKAIESDRQAAVLVPTTVLAEQHERTFKERMADYPVRIESLSRFKTPKQQKQILADLKAGRVDVIIGTHRLLSEDVTFADLGLVVIDEEQRFGVEHKQKLFQFRLTADVMTLTATPIPRTLHMSMLGLRDISSLSTPPMDRRAVVTEVIRYDPDRIRQAIIRELNRDGQTFYLHNRVHDIQTIADQVHRLVPEARIAVGHGQMVPRELEKVMLQFVRRRIDVLVCTTIIESGIDIPTANTIIIDNADHFGLAELHQLRGRVGRYKHRAYCYLVLPEDRTITDTAAGRLKAIEQYAMLGAGFKIAMRDLEIRGAGNLLGAEQSGHVASVGYEMYCKLLETEARHLRNDGVTEPVRAQIELPIAGRIPRQYIGSDKHRMDGYRRICRARSLDDLQSVARELTEAYGPPPPLAVALLDLAQLSIAAGDLEIRKLKLDGPDVIFTTTHPQKLQAVLNEAAGRSSLIDPQTVYYRPPPDYLDSPQTLLAILRKMLGATVGPVPGAQDPTTPHGRWPLTASP